MNGILKPAYYMVIYFTAFFGPFSIASGGEPDYVEIANRYREQYARFNAIIYESETVYEFHLDKKTGKPIAILDHQETIISLRTKNEIVRSITYDTYSNIKRHPFRTNEYGFARSCGAYEIENVFYHDKAVCYYKIPMWSVGTKYDFKYKKEYEDLKYLVGVYFTDGLPVITKKVRFIIPDWIDIELLDFNFNAADISKKTERVGKTTIVEYTIRNQEPKESEKLMPGPSYVLPHILILTKAYNLDGQTIAQLGSVDDLYAWYASLVDSVFNDEDKLKPLVEELIEGKETDEARIKAIYYWVQDNIRYIAFEDGIAGFMPEEAHLVFDQKYGDCKGMANLTKAMLAVAGYDARLTWIGTNRLAYDYSIPSLAVDNHMICTVINGEKKYILDGTEKYIGLNDYAERIQGRQMLIEEGEGYRLETVPVLGKERNLTKIEQTWDIRENVINGNGTTVYNGEGKIAALNFVNNTEAKSQTELLEYSVSRGEKNFRITSVTSSNIFDRENPFKVNYQFELANKISSFGNDVYITYDVHRDFADLQVEDDRSFDLVFSEKIFKKTWIRINIPSGFKLKHLPENLQVQNEAFSFNINFSQGENAIIYEKEISIEDGTIRKKQFDVWNKCLEQLRKVYNDQIVLTKID